MPVARHSNLTDALAAGKPIAYLIGTPAFCQIGVCGPVLDFLLDGQTGSDGDQFAMVHAEVYRPTKTVEQPRRPRCRRTR